MTPNQFLRAVNKAEKGEKIVYHRGYTGDLQSMEKDKDALRRTVAKCYIENRVTMLQRKTGVFKTFIRNGIQHTINEFEYIALKL